MHTSIDTAALQEFRQQEKLMGNCFEITVVVEDAARAENKIASAIAEIRRIERLLTTFADDSQANLINRNAGIRPVAVDREVFSLIQRANRISEITQGAFDLSYGSLDKKLWNFDQSLQKLPSLQEAQAGIRLINFRNIQLDETRQTVFLTQKGMRIGFGGIGKGYAAEMAKALLIREGVAAGIVNASGDLTTWGYQANGRPWTIGIAHPDHADFPFSSLEISGIAVATSGNYEKYVVIDGKKYSHTINPKTGLPVTGIKSVTIISPNAELSDAMATPVTIMGVEAGLSLVNQIHHLECIIIDDDNRVFTSKNINLV